MNTGSSSVRPDSPRVLVVGYANATQHVLEAMYACGTPPVALLTLAEDHSRSFSDRGDFKTFVEQKGMAVIPIRHVNDAETSEIVRRLQADALFVMGWSQIVGPAILALFPRGSFGLHPSYLPSNKGRAPISWTILNGETKSAVSFFRLEDAVDSGVVHVQVVFDVAPRETATTLYAKVGKAIHEGIPQLLQQLERQRFLEVRSGQRESYNFARRPEDGCIDWSRGAAEIDRLIRATTRPYPGAFTARRSSRTRSWEKVIFWESDLLVPSGRLRSFRALPGQVVGRTADGDILVSTGDGVLVFKEVELVTGGPLRAKDYRIREGERLGFGMSDLFFP